MGILDFINKIKNYNANKTENQSYAKMLNGTVPIFSQFGQDIYASDVVQQAISCIITEIKKLNPRHVREDGTTVQIVTDRELNRLLENPNEIMTTSEFIEKIFWNLFLNYNSFIYPTYELYVDSSTKQTKRKYTGLYPLQPTQVDFMQDPSNRLYVKFYFNNGTNVTIPYEDIIHIKYRYSINEFMGGNKDGQPDNTALLKTLQINHVILENISKAIKISYAVNGIVKYNTMMDQEKMDKAIETFNDQLRNNSSGLVGLDFKSEFVPINRNVNFVDEKLLEFIDKKILRHFGVSIAILEGDYTKAQYEAFYQKTIEPLIIAVSQAFTKVLFSSTERSYGNKILFYTEDLVFLSNDEKLKFISEAGGRGALTNNQILKMFGLPPYPEGDTRYMSLNYVDVSIANQYQINRSTKGGGSSDENK